MRNHFYIFLLLCLQPAFAQVPPAKYQKIWTQLNMSEPGSEPVMKELKKLRDKNPDDPWIYWISGINCNPVTEVEAAAAFYRQAIAVDPAFPHAYYNLASTIDDTTPEALREKIGLYTKAVTYDPMLGFAFLSRGHAYLELNEYDAAMADYRLSRQCPDMDTLQSEMLRLKILLKQDRKPEALKLVREVDFANGFWGTGDELLLATLYEETGDRQKACTCYRNAAEPYEVFGESLPENIAAGLRKCK